MTIKRVKDGFDFNFPSETKNVLTLGDKKGRDYHGIERTPPSFLNEFMRERARVMNQFIYYKFKAQKDIDIVPLYVKWNPRTHVMNAFIRTDWLKLKITTELNFPRWLYKKGEHKKSKIAEKFLEGKQDKNSRQSPWWRKMYKEYLEETKDDVMYSKIKNEGFPMIHMEEERGDDFSVSERIGKSSKKSDNWYKQFFMKPIQDKDMLKLLDPENQDMVWGDDNMTMYVKDHGTDIKMYNSIMNEVQDIMYKEFLKIDFNKEFKLSKELEREEDEEGNNFDYFDDPVGAPNAPNFQPMFPNIKKLRKWFVKTGIINSDGRHHKFTPDAYLDLKTNTQRANFIDSAVFLIGLSIYEENGGKYDMRSSIENARSQRGKSRGEDTREDWRDGNKKEAALLTRILRHKRRSDARAQSNSRTNSRTDKRTRR